MVRTFIIAVVGIILAGMHTGQAQIGFSIGGDSTDVAQDICFDPYGNFIVVGSFSHTSDFDPGPSIYNLTSNGLTDNYIAKYASNGSFVWAINFGGPGADVAYGVTTDGLGNIYVCGAFSSQCDFNAGAGTDLRSPKGMTDAYIIKYNYDGIFVWVNTFGGDSLDAAYDIIHDGESSLYVTGSFQDTLRVKQDDPNSKVISNGQKDLIVVRYEDNGQYNWVYSFGDEGNDEGLGIALHSKDTLYFAGYTTRSIIEPPSSISGVKAPENSADIFFAARTSSNALLWSASVGGKGHDQVAPGGIAVNNYGDVYITGWFSDSVDFDPTSQTVMKVSKGGNDVFMAKYSSGRSYMSGFSFGGTDNDQAYNLGVDWQGNVFLTGCFRGSADFDPGAGERTITSSGINGAADLFVAKYSPTGIFFWANGYGAPVSGGEKATCGYSILNDSLSNCFVAGKFFGSHSFDPAGGIMNFTSKGLSDGFIMKYNHNGMLWMNQPDITISSKVADFGDIPINERGNEIRELYNPGDGILVISSITSTNIRFRILESTDYILPSRNFQLTMEFAPITLGLHTGYIIIEHNGPSQRDSILVTGNGFGRPVSMLLSFDPGWNMMSLPAQVNDASVASLFPEAISDAFDFYDGSYRTRDTIYISNGYWLKFDEAQNVLIEGAARDTMTKPVRQGWNLIGAISSSVPVDSIIQEPPGIIASGFFDYNGNYFESSVLLPGRSYWVKMNAEGRLYLQGSEFIKGRNTRGD